MKNFRYNGFSLIEILIAVGIASGLSIALLKMTQEQAVVQKRTESSFEINTISNLITQNLLISDSCSNTIGVGQVITNGLVLNGIKNRKSITIYDTSLKYGSNSIKLQSITLADLTLSAAVANRKYGEVNIVNEFLPAASYGVSSCTTSVINFKS